MDSNTSQLTEPEIMLLSRIRSVNTQIIFNLLRAQNANFSKLPSLPLPALEKTMAKYLKSVEPFLNNEELKKTAQLVEHFKNGPGKELQKLLEERTKKYVNWLSDWWLETAYLGYRDPVVVYSSPGLVFPQQKFATENDQLQYTAKLILGALAYKSEIDKNKIKQEFFGKDPLDMTQYNKIFGTCRIPGIKVDHLEYNPQSKHVAVVVNNNFWKLPVVGCDDKFLSVDALVKCLKEILDCSKNKGPAVGILTADYRDPWAQAYQDLSENPKNLLSLRNIEQSLFLICLDNSINKQDDDRTHAGKLTIHGGGSCGNAANRWYDKTIQFIVGKDGYVGLTYEHSPSEGQPVAVMVDYVLNFIEKGNISSTQDSSLKPRPLQFETNEQINKWIEHASQTVDKLSENLALNVCHFSKFGKEFLKQQKLSPDSFIQVAIQSAFYLQHGEPAAHYESAATRKFARGRTETIRSCSTEVVDFAKSLLSENCSPEQKVDLLRKAIAAHKTYTNEALQGLGVDRHLLGLKLVALENKLPLPDLYKDVSYSRSTHMRLSTSQVATKADGFMCYGPIVADGYGCCYNPRPNDINFAVSAWKNNKCTNAQNYTQSLVTSLTCMQKILVEQVKNPSSKL